MKKFFCPAPWRSLYYHVDKSAVCCISAKKFDMSPVEFMNSDYLKNLKTKFLNDEFDETCQGCKSLEDAGLQSIRQHLLRLYGESTVENLDYMELRASNLCNFQCKMCDGDSSSLISGIVNTVSESDWDEILTLAENLKYLTLTGGEPMLIKHYYQLLDHLIAKGKSNIDLRVYTNGSVYNPIFVDKLLQFNSTLNLSIDGVGRTAELQRTGTDWGTVKGNVDKFLELPVGIKFHTTLTNISIIDVHSLAQYFVDIIARKPDCRFVAHTANSPKHLAIYNLATPLCKTALRSIERALDLLTGPQFEQLREQLTAHQSLLSKRVNAI